jgi:hypothetical protein
MNEFRHSTPHPYGAQASVTWGSDRARVVVDGEFDASFEEAGAAIVTLLTEHRLPVGIDLSGVTLFCAAGVNWLGSLYGAVEDEAHVVAASAQVRRVLAICGMPLHSAGRARSAPHWSVSLN